MKKVNICRVKFTKFTRINLTFLTNGTHPSALRDGVAADKKIFLYIFTKEE